MAAKQNPDPHTETPYPEGDIAVLGGDARFSAATLLRAAGMVVADAEAPPRQISDALAARHGFGFASVRAGPLGELRQVRQLAEQAISGQMPKNIFWKQPDGSYVDGLRAGVDPVGQPKLAGAEAYRLAHLAALRGLLASAPLIVLPLTRNTALVDSGTGTAFAPPPEAIALPKTRKFLTVTFTEGEMEQDFAALHGALKGLNPLVRLRLVIPPATGTAQDYATEALLRRLAAGWSQRFADVTADPLADHLMCQMSGTPEAGAGPAGALLAALMRGADLAGALAALPQAGPPAPSAEDQAQRRRERRKRRAERAARAGQDQEAKVQCEDELLEAFS